MVVADAVVVNVNKEEGAAAAANEGFVAVPSAMPGIGQPPKAAYTHLSFADLGLWPPVSAFAHRTDTAAVQQGDHEQEV